MEAPVTRPKLRWRLRVMMAERDIRSAAELARRLEPYGLKMSAHQISRVVSKLPRRLNTKFLMAVTTELDCSVHDLLQLDRPR